MNIDAVNRDLSFLEENQIDGNRWIPERIADIYRSPWDLPNGVFVCGDSMRVVIRHGLYLIDRIMKKIESVHPDIDAIIYSDVDGFVNFIQNHPDAMTEDPEHKIKIIGLIRGTVLVTCAAAVRVDVGGEDDLLDCITNLDPVVRVLFLYDCNRSVNHSAVYLTATVELILQHFRQFNVIPIFCDRSYNVTSRFRGAMFDHCFASISADGVTDDGLPECSARVRVRFGEMRYFMDPTSAVFDNGLFYSPVPMKALDKAQDCGVYDRADYIGTVVPKETWEKYEPEKEYFVRCARSARREIEAVRRHRR